MEDEKQQAQQTQPLQALQADYALWGETQELEEPNLSTSQTSTATADTTADVDSIDRDYTQVTAADAAASTSPRRSAADTSQGGGVFADSAAATTATAETDTHAQTDAEASQPHDAHVRPGLSYASVAKQPPPEPETAAHAETHAEHKQPEQPQPAAHEQSAQAPQRPAAAAGATEGKDLSAHEARMRELRRLVDNIEETKASIVARTSAPQQPQTQAPSSGQTTGEAKPRVLKRLAPRQTARTGPLRASSAAAGAPAAATAALASPTEEKTQETRPQSGPKVLKLQSSRLRHKTGKTPEPFPDMETLQKVFAKAEAGDKEAQAVLKELALKTSTPQLALKPEKKSAAEEKKGSEQKAATAGGGLMGPDGTPIPPIPAEVKELFVRAQRGDQAAMAQLQQNGGMQLIQQTVMQASVQPLLRMAEGGNRIAVQALTELGVIPREDAMRILQQMGPGGDHEKDTQELGAMQEQVMAMLLGGPDAQPESGGDAKLPEGFPTAFTDESANEAAAGMFPYGDPSAPGGDASGASAAAPSGFWPATKYYFGRARRMAEKGFYNFMYYGLFPLVIIGGTVISSLWAASPEGRKPKTRDLVYPNPDPDAANLEDLELYAQMFNLRSYLELKNYMEHQAGHGINLRERIDPDSDYLLFQRPPKYMRGVMISPASPTVKMSKLVDAGVDLETAMAYASKPDPYPGHPDYRPPNARMDWERILAAYGPEVAMDPAKHFPPAYGQRFSESRTRP